MKNKEFDIFAKKHGFENQEAMCRAMDTYGIISDIAETQQESIDYCQVVEMSREEKVAMYMKLTKRELIEMLLLNQELLEKQIGNNRNDWPPQLPSGKCTTNYDIGVDWTHRTSSTSKTPQDLNRSGSGGKR